MRRYLQVEGNFQALLNSGLASNCSGLEPHSSLQKRSSFLNSEPVYPPFSPKTQDAKGPKCQPPHHFPFLSSSFHLFTHSFVNLFIQRVPSDCLQFSPFSTCSFLWILAALLSEHSWSFYCLKPNSPQVEKATGGKDKEGLTLESPENWDKASSCA